MIEMDKKLHGDIERSSRPCPEVQADRDLVTGEARISPKNGLVWQWARSDTRTLQPAGQRYESTDLFGAMRLARGGGADLVMSLAYRWAMHAHLDEIAATVAEGDQAVLLLDRAGWHATDNLIVPKNSPSSSCLYASRNSTRSRVSVSTWAPTGARNESSTRMPYPRCRMRRQE
jgi:hypothetical protein